MNNEEAVEPICQRRERRFRERRFRPDRTEETMIFERCKLLAAEIQARKEKK